ncbi:hypothetical protein ACF0H5_020992 [Mactra antiquata]
MPSHRYPKCCYIMLRDLDNLGRRTWASKVRETLFKFGFGYAWIAQEIGDEKVFFSQIKLRITDILKQEWHNNISESSRCDHYIGLKSLLDLEFYLKSELPYYLRKKFLKIPMLQS